jgi:nitroimidazol reductase NimA-like FMN-containing flavoprotein (pyridoxamine 5'-phosphate oxidase superfamily)
MNTHSAMTPPSHTGLVELSPEECWRLLEAAGAGRLAVTVGTTPDIFPVNYRVKDGEIVIRTEAGTKLAAATLMSAVAFEIDEIDHAQHKGWSVVVKGYGREPVTLDEGVAPDELDIEPWVDVPKTRWLVITPTEVTGRRIPP